VVIRERHAANSRTYFFFTGPLLVCWISDMAAGERKGQVLEGASVRSVVGTLGGQRSSQTTRGERAHACTLCCWLVP